MESSQLPFNVLLKYHRERNKLSMKALGDLVETDHSYISRMEAGERMPSHKMAKKLAPILNLTRAQSEQFFAAAGYMRPGTQAVESADIQKIDILLHDPALNPVVKVTIEGLLRSIVFGLEAALDRKGSDDEDQAM